MSGEGAQIPSDHTRLVPAAKNSFKTSKSPFQLCKRLAASAGQACGEQGETKAGGTWPPPAPGSHLETFLLAFYDIFS